ncbi:MAG: hypothetical protein JWN06_3949 [Propionibacteriaceae bacterium]|jgi:hypothetical protein|nr:hypothetical protein [Propionibacteriaceae bacterium]
MDFDPGMNLAEQFRAHAGDRDHLYAHATRGMADDWEAGGPVRQICAGYEDSPPRLMIHLRLLAGIFRLVLTGRAVELRPFYPCLGGQQPPDQAWPLMRAAAAEHIAELRGALDVAPQTNEVGRSAALLTGLFDLVGAAGCDRVRLLELGASAGLNLLLDQFYFSGEGWQYGPADSPVCFPDAVEGPVRPSPFRLTDRRGCDLEPVDVTTEEGRVMLTSFVWPFDLHRHARLAAVLPLAERSPPTVDAASAGEWLAEQLKGPAEPGELTVVWHSITRMYWPESEVQQVLGLLASRGAERQLGQVSLEYGEGAEATAPQLRTSLWQPESGCPVRERLLGTTHEHGIPVRVSAR